MASYFAEHTWMLILAAVFFVSKNTWKGGVNYLKAIKRKAGIPTIPTTTAVLLISCFGSGLRPATGLSGQVCGDKEGPLESRCWPAPRSDCGGCCFVASIDFEWSELNKWLFGGFIFWCANLNQNLLCFSSSHCSPPVSFQPPLDLGYCFNRLSFLCWWSWWAMMRSNRKVGFTFVSSTAR